MKVLLIRHAESANNRSMQSSGSSAPSAEQARRAAGGRVADPGITELGHQQAAALGRWLGSEEPRPSRLFSSLMTRAIETSRPVAEALDLPIEGRDDLYECVGPYEGSYGNATLHPGSPREQLQALTPRLQLPDSVTDEGWWRGPIEDAAGAMRRALRIADWLAGLEEECVAIVCHAAISSMILSALIDPDRLRAVSEQEDPGAHDLPVWFPLDNTSISCVELNPGEQTFVDWVNRIDHLREVADHQPSKVNFPFPPSRARAHDNLMR
ncbi:histidine phosphatase family protein [Parenemella sanctibonifatiensis]|uniref:Phosphoglycerate mutase n=1 Tax=Parenemella sanctibonifatiensis TaxID=2016505 RepID=A0A255E8I7_9ACTN|nr:histidine phosphatase family protein [Parenemella sanctibonifatiensis]OYN87826.1 phosphoglycerate mutase [Parenemella sanctibonifatiensis]